MSLSRQLDRLEYSRLLPREREAALAAIAEEVETFWLSDTVRANRPTVLHEVEHALDVVESSLLEVVPRVYRDLESSPEPYLPGTALAGTRLSALRILDRRRSGRESQRDAHGHGTHDWPAARDAAAALPQARR